jgi:uncharacterized damage-inducible protein DinB
MGDQTQVLAERLEQANRELIAAIERCSDSQWQARCADEGWSVGVAAHHLAVDHVLLAGLAQAVATGQAVPALTADMIDQYNAQHAQQHTVCTREETIALLETEGATAAGIVRSLSDAQLERSAVLPWEAGPPWSARRVIEEKLIGHVADHLANIRAAVGQGVVAATP